MTFSSCSKANRGLLTFSRPLPVTMPNSARWPRSALIVSVRCPMSKSRIPSTIPKSCRSGVLTSTKRIVGRLVASTIASVSAISFFWFFTEGSTNLERDQLHFMARPCLWSSPVTRCGASLRGNLAAKGAPA